MVAEINQKVIGQQITKPLKYGLYQQTFTVMGYIKVVDNAILVDKEAKCKDYFKQPSPEICVSEMFMFSSPP
jgi:hypothetical protein